MRSESKLQLDGTTVQLCIQHLKEMRGPGCKIGALAGASRALLLRSLQPASTEITERLLPRVREYAREDEIGALCVDNRVGLADRRLSLVIVTSGEQLSGVQRRTGTLPRRIDERPYGLLAFLGDEEVKAVLAEEFEVVLQSRLRASWFPPTVLLDADVWEILIDAGLMTAD